MDNTKKIIALAAAAALTLSLAACSGNNSSSTADNSSSDASSTVIRVGASPSPHAEILEFAKDQLAAKGYELEIVEFTDYVMPNVALYEGDLDANFFQHTPYLDNYNEQNSTDLVSACKVHFEPMGLYSETLTSVSDVAEGSKVGVPNDPTNEARALNLLEAQGLIKLREGAGLNATPLDIEENPLNLEFVELEAAQLPRNLSEFAIAAINGNYAIEAGILDKVIVNEAADSESAQEYANILAVQSGELETDKTKALVEALTSDETREFINTQYEDQFIPVF
ncbi:MetQ/NlpA family ABC transporter substrate-binding protein [Hydrogenoanaerobacterium saccharovorans]|uniref:Lipoprotein n=1 Tax=Hydrogenoanaerobacterium saccharovorans TaxID=474960 RepID=A0ABS2GQE4_9FIRM|nr:MetQ/NlpA family ABC transporter substrate-binding protein [Hydrogenoanaerobacterium saccharovorans]MBM6923619.1 MetQ/NlpA family ABC transporter substrate-binding protein [Hydrogenoanaerobacterium saccharovorans]